MKKGFKKAIVTATSKVCTKCNVLKPFNEFWKCSGHNDKLSYVCKECKRIKNRKERPDIIKIIDNKKVCSKCKEMKDVSNFRLNSTLKCGLHSQCHNCELIGRRAHKKKILESDLSIQKKEGLKQSFNMTPKQFIKMVNAQNNKCYICGQNEDSKNNQITKGIKNLCIDHDHENGMVRGLLCGKCNAGLGMFKDNIDILCQAVLYLEYFNHLKKQMGE